jgi:hypothetical protein
MGQLGGVVTSSASAAVPSAGVAAVFARGTNGHFYYRQRSSALVWSPGWQVVDPALTFRRLGAWVDTFDYSALTPSTVVADLQAHKVRTLYLATARFDSAYQYTRDNVLLSRQLTGLPVHVAGGVGDTATLNQVSDYVRAARDSAAAGGSLYDYLTTKVEVWPYLEQLTP